jgi:hypothetical protein
MLVNNLSGCDAVEYTQAGCSDEWRGVLPTNRARSFNWPYAGTIILHACMHAQTLLYRTITTTSAQYDTITIITAMCIARVLDAVCPIISFALRSSTSC